MQESLVYQDITQRARAEGIQLATIESILELLEVRFQTTPTVIKSTLEAIDDTQHLKELYREAAETETLAPSSISCKPIRGIEATESS